MSLHPTDQHLSMTALSRRRFVQLGLAVAAGAGASLLGACGGSKPAPSSPAKANLSYPLKSVDFLVPYGAAGGADQLARLLSPLLEKMLGATFAVANIPGATGVTGVNRLLAGNPDGSAIAVYIADTHAVAASGTTPWKVGDLAPIARMQKVPSFLFVRDDSPFITFDDLDRAVKGVPGEMKVSTLGKGSVDEVTLSFMATKGFKATSVPFADTNERFNAVVSGQTQMLYEQAGDVRALLNNGQIRPILVFNETRLPEFPKIPTSKERGYDIFLAQFRGIMAKAGTPQPLLDILSSALTKAADAPEMQSFAKTQYMTRDSFLPSSAFKGYLDKETGTLDTLMKELKLKA